MRLRTVNFVFHEALSNIRRNPVLSLASASTAAISLLVLGVFLVLTANLNHLASLTEAQIEIQAFLQPNLSQTRVRAIGDELRDIPGVAHVTLVSQEEALAELKADFGSERKILDRVVRDNPDLAGFLLTSYRVRTVDPRSVPTVAAAMGRISGVRKVTYQAGVVNRLFRLVDILRLSGLVLGLLLLFGSLLIIQNAIRMAVFARRREVSIMHLVGATDSLVRLPFLLEGIILGLLGGGIASGLLYVAYRWAYGSLSVALPFLPLEPPASLQPAGVSILLIGAAVGLLGSYISLGKLLSHPEAK